MNCRRSGNAAGLGITRGSVGYMRHVGDIDDVGLDLAPIALKGRPPSPQSLNKSHHVFIQQTLNF